MNGWGRTALRIGVLFVAARVLIATPLPKELAGAGLIVSLAAVLVAGLLEEDYDRKWLAVVLVALLIETGRIGMTVAMPVLARLK